ncbi:hypothetical protein [Evansella cellulosilytica]|uniref:Uncharacterized protein n=1 Tax=Evansella cellulosilytica (strain ATCC 21833 / DSM 2522 / FERM P-1141 / JCM 9156 / N-4) TaxID=649639 RepID=E6U0X6_EVAC2|nr:hypothetical protein [Evansella cellulosilytica]ADU30288.1 hypothetical protein Bcell_2026 [Evansella cellulosilytica DSM 2522]
MIPQMVMTIAWVIIGIRAGLKFFHLINRKSKDWLEILFHLSIVIVALSFVT